MKFELTVLGSSSAMPASGKYPTAHVLNVHERFYLIDCGEGTQIQLRRSKISFAKIDHIFISHLHGDHVFGIFGLLSSFALLGRKNKLVIYGPKGIKNIIDFYLKQFAYEDHFPIQVNTIINKVHHKIFENRQIEVFAIPLKHRVTAFGYHFIEKEHPRNINKEKIKEHNLSVKEIKDIKEGKDIYRDDGETLINQDLTLPAYKRRSYAFCSDTAMYKKIIPYIYKTDLLYHEATFATADQKTAKKTGHSTAQQAASIAKQANVGKLLIGHFSTRYKDADTLLREAKAEFNNTSVAKELDKHTIKLQRNP